MSTTRLSLLSDRHPCSLGNCKEVSGSLASLAGLTDLEMLKLEGVFSLKGDETPINTCTHTDR